MDSTLSPFYTNHTSEFTISDQFRGMASQAGSEVTVERRGVSTPLGVSQYGIPGLDTRSRLDSPGDIIRRTLFYPESRYPRLLQRWNKVLPLRARSKIASFTLSISYPNSGSKITSAPPAIPAYKAIHPASMAHHLHDHHRLCELAVE